MATQSLHRSCMLASLVLITAGLSTGQVPASPPPFTGFGGVAAPFRFAQEYTAENVTVREISMLCPKPPSFSVVETTIDLVHAAFMNGSLTCTDLVNIYVDRINAYNKITGLNCIQRMNPNLLADAAVLDDVLELVLSGNITMPALLCVPLLVKDNYNTMGMPTSNGARALADAMPVRDATMIKQLKDVGAIVLAKTTMSEWAFGIESIGSMYGVSRNPYDLNRYSGGSSGGTGAGIGSNLGLIGLGSDTGGSVRVPAAHQALVGIRPTLGFTSRVGIVPLRSNADTGGILGRSVRDVAKLLTVVAGVQDPLDPIATYSAGVPVPNYEDFLIPNALNGTTFGILLDYVETTRADPQYKAMFYQAIANMTAAGATFVNFTIPGWRGFFDGTEQIRSFPNADGIPKAQNASAGGSAQSFFLIDGLYEALRNCNPFKTDIGDFLTGGSTTTAFKSAQEVLDSGLIHPNAYGTFQILTATNYTKCDFHNDFRYQGATCGGCTELKQDVCRMGMRTSLLAAMEEAGVDALVYLATSNPARVIGDRTAVTGANSQLAPQTGTPSVTVPIGFVAYPGAGAAVDPAMPVAMEFLGKPFEEHTILQAAYGVETLLKARMPPRGFGECGTTNLVVSQARRSLIGTTEIDTIVAAADSNQM